MGENTQNQSMGNPHCNLTINSTNHIHIIIAGMVLIFESVDCFFVIKLLNFTTNFLDCHAFTSDFVMLYWENYTLGVRKLFYFLVLCPHLQYV